MKIGFAALIFVHFQNGKETFIMNVQFQAQNLQYNLQNLQRWPQ